jgi:hypothetical protein
MQCPAAEHWGDMGTSTNHGIVPARLRLGIVLRVLEDTCEVFSAGQAESAGFARHFPTPRTQRVCPGHLAAVATAQNGSDVVIWRWYDAVVLGEEGALVRMWEPAHGEVLAQPRRPQQPRQPGARAYLSAGLPGADWWLAGAVGASAEVAEVELDAVAQFYTDHGLWNELA